MFSKFCVTRSKNAKFSSLPQRLGACFSSRVLGLAAATVAVALMPSLAISAPFVPAADWRITFSNGDTGFPPDFIRPGSYHSTRFGGDLSAVASGTGGVLGGALLEAHAVGAPGVRNAVAVTLNYSYVVDGYTAGVVVPMRVTFSLFTDEHHNGLAGGAAVASLTVAGTTGDAHSLVEAFGGGCSPLCGDGGTLLFTQTSGAVAEVMMSVFAYTADPNCGIFFYAECNTPWSADAYADPFIYIDPDFLARNPGGSVIVSDGIGNVAPAAPGVSGVPEPVTLALFGVGLAGMGLSRRRHQRKS